MISAALVRPKSRSAFAADDRVAGHERDRGRSLEQRQQVRRARPPPAARRARVFLKILYSVSAGRSAPRSSASAVTVRPRYSVSTAASASPSFVRISSTTATFSGLAMRLPGPTVGTPRDLEDDTPMTATIGCGRFPEAASSGGHTPWGPVRGSRASGPLPRVRDRRSVACDEIVGRGRYYTAAFAESSRRVTEGSMRTPGPIVDDVVTPFRYRPFEAAGFARLSSSRTEW